MAVVEWIFLTCLPNPFSSFSSPQTGFNLAGLSFLRRRLEEEGKIAAEAPLFHDASNKFKQKLKKAKKSRTEGEEAVKTAAIMTIA